MFSQPPQHGKIDVVHYEHTSRCVPLHVERPRYDGSIEGQCFGVCTGQFPDELNIFLKRFAHRHRCPIETGSFLGHHDSPVGATLSVSNPRSSFGPNLTVPPTVRPIIESA